MRDTSQYFLSASAENTHQRHQMTYYEVCLASENALIGSHTSEFADLGEALSSIFEGSRQRTIRPVALETSLIPYQHLIGRGQS